MAEVEVRVLAPPGVQPVTSFADTFVRADQPFFLGDDWYLQITQDTGVGGSDFAANINVTGNKAVFGDGVHNLNSANAMLIPATLSVPIVRQRSLTRGLFAQMQITSVAAGIDGQVGPIVFANPNDQLAYGLVFNSTPGTVELFAGIGAAPRVLLNPAFNYALNDMIRLECVLGVAANTLKTYKNGVLQNTFVDNDPARIPSTHGGLFGIGYYATDVGVLGFNNFSGGLI